MGCELVNTSSPHSLHQDVTDQENTEISYTERFKEACPYYMAIGMSYDDYWNGDCVLTKYYREAYEIKLKQQNEAMWLQGLYIHDAVGVVVANALKKKGAKAAKYADSPYPVTPIEQREVKRKEEKQRYERNKAKMKRIMEAVNARFKSEVKKDAHD